MANPNPNKDTRFKKGQSGNPKGRHRSGVTLTEILRELGELEDVRHDGKMIARKEALGHKMWSLALSGKDQTMRYMYDRLDGKPTQEIKVQSDAAIDAPIYITIAGAKIESDTEGDE